MEATEIPTAAARLLAVALAGALAGGPLCQLAYRLGGRAGAPAPFAAQTNLFRLALSAMLASAFLRYGPSAEAVELSLLAGALAVLSVTDLLALRIPNGCLLVAVAARLAFLAWGRLVGEGVSLGAAALTYLLPAVAVAAVLTALGLLMDRVLGRESIGWGDVKLLAVGALYLGPLGTPLLVFLGSLLGLAFAAARAARSRLARRGRPSAEGGAFPWGPSIAAALWALVLLGEGGLGRLIGTVLA